MGTSGENKNDLMNKEGWSIDFKLSVEGACRMVEGVSPIAALCWFKWDIWGDAVEGEDELTPLKGSIPAGELER